MTFKHPLRPNRITDLLIGGLRALQIMQDRAEVEAGQMQALTHDGLFPPPSDTEIDALMRALSDGHIRLVPVVSNVVTFKRSAKEVPCNP